MTPAPYTPLGRSALCLVACLLASVAAAGETQYTATPSGSRTQVDTSFRSYDASTLTLSFTLDSAAVRTSMQEFGYADVEVKALLAVCTAEQCGQSELDRRVERYYRDHGMTPTYGAGNSLKLTVDIASVVRKNGTRIRPVAAELERVSGTRGYGADQQIAATLAFVQTALPYRQPPMSEGGRQIVGFYPPPRLLEAGWGDCDSKSALLAAIISNYQSSHMVGVHLPGHYLVGIDRVPRSGDAYIEYRGVPYVLMEASGPAMLAPGRIAETTQAALNTVSGVRIDPIF